MTIEKRQDFGWVASGQAAAGGALPPPAPMVQRSKSFLVLFFKKAPL
jgi:hypothetical protein